MNAIQCLSERGGTVRITVFRAFQKLPTVHFLANVIVSCTAIDRAELIPVNIFSAKGILKFFPDTGKLFLDFRHSKDPEYPNFWFGTGFADYVNSYTVKKLLDLIPSDSTDPHACKYVEFRVLSDGAIQNVDIRNAYKQKRECNAETIASYVRSKQYDEKVEEELVDINSIIGISNPAEEIIVE